jgi:small subunit ribosomal protein S20
MAAVSRSRSRQGFVVVALEWGYCQSACPSLTSLSCAGRLGVRDERDPYRISGEFFVPNIASAKKNMRKSRAATVRNRAQRSALRTALKKAKAPSASEAERSVAISLLDRAARKGLVHKNLAARQKSHLTKAVATA